MIYTSTGRFIDPFNLRAEDISITDIAHALRELIAGEAPDAK